MTRTRRLAATALLGLTVALAAAACGDEQEAPQADDTTSAVPAVTPPSDRSVPVVPGPKPKSATTTTETTTAEDDGESCGATKGPDGALQIRLVGGDVTCDTAKAVSKEYGPLIATGKPQTVNGWDCGPSQVVGELARCTKGAQTFALTPN